MESAESKILAVVKRSNVRQEEAERLERTAAQRMNELEESQGTLAEAVGILAQEFHSMRGGDQKGKNDISSEMERRFAMLQSKVHDHEQTTLAKLSQLDERLKGLEELRAADAKAPQPAEPEGKDVVLQAHHASRKGSLGLDSQPPATGLTSRHVTDLLPDEKEHSLDAELENSIWTSAFFIGLPLLGLGGSVVSFVVLLLNIAIQILFCGIVAQKFTGNNFMQENVDAYYKWRHTIAHDYQHYDPISGSSLASRVCSQQYARNSLSMSTIQSNDIEIIRDYLPDGGAWQLFLCGPTMCIIALVCWFSSIAGEVWELFALSTAAHNLPTAPTTEIQRIDGQLVMVTMTITRKTLTFFMVCIRLFILVVLCIAGTKYVVYTVSMQELLLNCVALAFVLDVPTLLVAFAPRRLLTITQSMKPMRRLKIFSWRGADGASFILLVLLLVSVFTAAFTMLKPLVQKIIQAEEYLCHGSLNFVYTIGASGNMVWTHTGEPRPFVLDSIFYKERSVKEILAADGRADTKLALHMPSMSQLRTHSNQENRDAFSSCGSDRLEDYINQMVLQSTVRVFINRNQDSSDFLQAGGLIEQEVLKIDRCQPFSWLCMDNGDLGVKMRLLCPVTCGCSNASRYVINRDANQGCDDSCGRIAARSLATFAKFFCEDDEPAVVSSANFLREFDDYKDRARDLPAYMREDARIFHFGDMLHEHGCGAIARYHQEYADVEPICDHLGFHYFLHVRCPVSCGCRDTFMGRNVDVCPLQCYFQVGREHVTNGKFIKGTFIDAIQNRIMGHLNFSSERFRNSD